MLYRSCRINTHTHTLAGIATWRFGATRNDFTSFSTAMRTEFSMFFGNFPDDWDDDPEMIWFTVSYLLILFLLVQNFLLAIVVESYMQVRVMNEELESEGEFLSDVGQSMYVRVFRYWYNWPKRRQLALHLQRNNKPTVGLRDFLAARVLRFSGASRSPLKWREELRPLRFSQDKRIDNQGLTDALRERVQRVRAANCECSAAEAAREAKGILDIVFSKAEWDRLGVKTVSVDSYAKVDGSFFRPVVEEGDRLFKGSSRCSEVSAAIKYLKHYSAFDFLSPKADDDGNTGRRDHGLGGQSLPPNSVDPPAKSPRLRRTLFGRRPSSETKTTTLISPAPKTRGTDLKQSPLSECYDEPNGHGRKMPVAGGAPGRYFGSDETLSRAPSGGEDAGFGVEGDSRSVEAEGGSRGVAMGTDIVTPKVNESEVRADADSVGRGYSAIRPFGLVSKGQQHEIFSSNSMQKLFCSPSKSKESSPLISYSRRELDPPLGNAPSLGYPSGLKRVASAGGQKEIAAWNGGAKAALMGGHSGEGGGGGDGRENEQTTDGVDRVAAVSPVQQRMNARAQERMQWNRDPAAIPHASDSSRIAPIAHHATLHTTQNAGLGHDRRGAAPGAALSPRLQPICRPTADALRAPVSSPRLGHRSPPGTPSSLLDTPRDGPTSTYDASLRDGLPVEWRRGPSPRLRLTERQSYDAAAERGQRGDFSPQMPVTNASEPLGLEPSSSLAPSNWLALAQSRPQDSGWEVRDVRNTGGAPIHAHGGHRFRGHSPPSD